MKRRAWLYVMSKDGVLLRDTAAWAEGPRPAIPDMGIVLEVMVEDLELPEAWRERERREVEARNGVTRAVPCP